MKNYILLGLFLIGSYYGNGQITIKQIRLPQPYVTVLRTEPEQPIEGGRIVVYFRFTNRIGNKLNGWIGADLSSGTSATGKSIIDWPITELEKDQSVDGAIMVNTTNAGVGKRLRVYFYEKQEPLMDNSIRKSEPLYDIGEKDMNIAALVNFKVTGFKINHTRARTTDTDWGSLYAVVDDVPVMEPASIFIGNFEDGTYPFKGKNAEGNMLEDVETGPVALVPGQNSRLYIAYTMYNGGGITDSKSFLNGYAEATANPIMFHGPRPGTSAAMNALKALNPFLNAIGACDGFVVMDTLTINTNGIFTNTKDGNDDFTKRYNSEDYSSQTGCGNTSDYEVNSSIRRMSNYKRASNHGALVFTNVTGNRTINVNEKIDPKIRQFFDFAWQRIETIDRQGNFIEMNDQAYGSVYDNKYHSPARVTRPLLVILRGSLISRNDEPKSLSTLNNGPFSQATAIVQLVPGVIISAAKTNIIPKEDQSAKPPTPPTTTEDYGKQDNPKTTEKILQNYIRAFVVTGEWRFKITSSGGSVFTGIVNLQQSGNSVTGNLLVSDNTKTAITGTFSGDALNLSRDTGLETIQQYQLSKKSNTFFSGTYQNIGKYPDSGTVEFFK